MKKIRIGKLLYLAAMAGCFCADAKPNILFILIDDMGWKDIGCAGSAYYKTPHIDRLASEGIRFLNAYSAAPVCTPSRGAIFSGKYPARTKLTTVFKGRSMLSAKQDDANSAHRRRVRRIPVNRRMTRP